MTSEDFYVRNDIVENYDNVRFLGVGGEYVNQKELNAVLEFINDENKETIEIGPGTGRLTAELIRKTKNLVLFDNSNTMLNLLKDKFKNKKIEFIQGDVRNMQIDKLFDYHISLRVFIHLNEAELNQALQSAHKILKKEGYLLFDTLNSRSLYPIIKPVSLFKSKFPYNHFINEKRMKEIIRKNGFEVVGIKRIFVIPKFIMRYAPVFKKYIIKLNEVLEKKFPKITTHTFWKVRKK